MNINTNIGRFRVIGISEGISYMLLLLVGMPLKYKMGIPEAVKIMGWMHGVLFKISASLLLWGSQRFRDQPLWKIQGQPLLTAITLTAVVAPRPILLQKAFLGLFFGEPQSPLRYHYPSATTQKHARDARRIATPILQFVTVL